MVKGRAFSSPQKIAIGIFGAFFALVVLVLSFFLYEGSTKPILAVADKFQPDSSWKLVGESVQPPRLFCLDVKCPSIYRSWDTNELVTRAELEKILESSGLQSLSFDGDCRRRPNESGTISLCSASGVVNSMNMNVSIRVNDYAEKDNKVILSVQ